jgi:hypothetical protein
VKPARAKDPTACLHVCSPVPITTTPKQQHKSRHAGERERERGKEGVEKQRPTRNPLSGKTRGMNHKKQKPASHCFCSRKQPCKHTVHSSKLFLRIIQNIY